MNEYLLQIENLPGANKLLEYGLLGLFALIFLSGYVYAILFIKKKYERHLTEKDHLTMENRKEFDRRIEEKWKEIQELKAEIKFCRDEHREFRNANLERLGSIIDRNSDIIRENNLTINENGSILNQVIGMTKINSDTNSRLIEIMDVLVHKFKDQ